MNIAITIHTGPLPERPIGLPGYSTTDGKTGAILSFLGIVRAIEADQPIEALDYDAYRPMADRMLQELAAETLARFGLLCIAVEHSVGRVPVGRCSFRLRVAAAHRREGLDAMDYFIDRLKQDVPIWKAPAPGSEAVK